MSPTMPPTIQVSLDEKVRMLASFVPSAIQHMNSQVEGDLSADDIIDLFAAAAALVIDNDSHVNTARDFRLAADTVASLVIKRAKEMREAHKAQGYSLLAAMLGQAGAVGPVN
ncbi:hypothetical protein EAH79_01730 [Sphingomonas koreensis]|nr:hypothetical protein EAH79_01730 [Sphingomonas koreensis]